ncbi:hypothetical protein [uncultured Winogradskyella sp.]|uniref:hypothetical protein n=1 Tax=uncultured Winogradskyella sp. TaxID=395353 RepID=UPI00260DAAEF|nr:hypothetical protein [uncultured Winogradskyella sp.]
MLGLLLLYWIGKYFYKLAEEYNKSKWGFSILGIAVYYAGIILASFTTGIVIGIFYPQMLENTNETVLGLFMLPFGILSCYLLYIILEKTWKKAKSDENRFLNQISE